MTRKVKCGDVVIGGGEQISIQSMTNVPTADVKACLEQVRRLEEAGCQIIRLTVNDMEAAAGFAEIKKKARVPLVADIHFDYRLALEAINAGADKIRINPGNIGSEERLKAVVSAAAANGIPIRVGVNSGSLEKDLIEKYGGVTARGLSESALRNVKLIEELGFEDIVISLKSSDVKMNNEAYRIVSQTCDYPLHIGVTEAGTLRRGIIKSSIGIGALLLDGIGDTLRVSLTADPVEEVIVGKQILDSLGLRKSAINLVSCPTCGRTEVDLEKIAESIEKELAVLSDKRAAEGRAAITVAVMGCAVNGPGEATSADIGVACGRKEGLIFAKGEIIKKVREDEIAEEIIRMVERI